MEDYKKTPLWNNHLPLEERLDYLIQELTLEEKISCLGFRFTCRYIDILYIQLPYPSAENS